MKKPGCVRISLPPRFLIPTDQIPILYAITETRTKPQARAIPLCSCGILFIIDKAFAINQRHTFLIVVPLATLNVG